MKFFKIFLALTAIFVTPIDAVADESKPVKVDNKTSHSSARASTNVGGLVRLTHQADNLRANFEDESAIKLYTNVLSLKADYEPALYGRARCLEAIGKYPEAVNDLKKCRGSSDEIGQDTTRELAKLLSALKQYPEALAAWNKLIDTFKMKSDGAYASRGEVYLAMHMYPEAIADFTAAYKTKKRPGLLSKRALAYLLNKQYKECIADCTSCLSTDRSAMESAQNNADTYTTRANAYEAIGQHALALKDRAAAKSSIQGNFDIAPFADKGR